MTAISRAAEDLLLELMKLGVKFRSRGVFTKHLLAQLTSRVRDDARESMRFTGVGSPKRIPVLLLLIVCLTSGARSQEARAKTGQLQGVVFVGDPDARSAVVGAKVVISGPATAETETNTGGECVMVDEIMPSVQVAQIPVS